MLWLGWLVREPKYVHSQTCKGIRNVVLVKWHKTVHILSVECLQEHEELKKYKYITGVLHKVVSRVHVL